ncbi:MAG TPA: MltA domain-containing protein [Nitrospirota bacterium]|nr:MltA domain-containing protein [Nitrospirota bacterium]
MNMKKYILAGILLLGLAACVRPPLVVTKPEEALSPVSSSRLLTLRDDLDFRDLAASVRLSLDYYTKLPPQTPFALGKDRFTALDMAASLRDFLKIIENDSLTADQKFDQIRDSFLFYRAAGSSGGGRVLITGYYEPTLSCRRSADQSFRSPLYRKPDDIIEIDLSQFGEGFPRDRIFGRLDGKKVIPYYSREDIDRKKTLAGKGLEILWCSDIIDIYVLQVQGSGKVDLGNGSMLSVLYDGSNGRPYKSIGKYLIDSGAMTKEKMSMQAIREYLHSHPDQVAGVLDQNPSYVFFRLDTGPSLGNIGVALTPWRSIATDSKLFPKGALGIISSQKPVIENGMIKSWVPFTRFVLNQDTGGAIKGGGRVDLFCGQGSDAELTAGNLQHDGELYFLMRKKAGNKKE